MKNFVFILTFLLFFSGCSNVFTNGVTQLNMQQIQNQESFKDGKKSVFIQSVNDKRIFENDPKQASTPSVYNEDVLKMSAEQKDIYFARKRNGWGKGTANVRLDNNQTVTKIIENHIAKAFVTNGFYLIKDRAQITKDTIVINANVYKFWTFVSMKGDGDWVTDIQTNIFSKDKAFKASIQYIKDIEFSMDVDNDVRQVTNEALEKYQLELSSKISQEFR